MDFDQHLVNIWLERAVREFSTNPLSPRLIRRIADELPELFMAAAVKYLDSEDQSGAHRFLASTLLRNPSVFEEVANPAFGPRQKAVGLFRRLLAVDPSADVKLAKRLPDRNGLNHTEAFDSARSARALDVLNETSVGRRLLPILSHLVDSPDPRTSEKATLFIGRRIQSVSWAARQLAKDDPRVRANAIEAIWGLKSSGATSLLEDCVDDYCNRVAGNALVGLHMAGRPGVTEHINDIVTAPKPVFRSTAAWTMGKIGDASFVSQLLVLMRDDHPEVRSAALRSLIQIRRSPVQPAPIEPEPIQQEAIQQEAIQQEESAVTLR